MSRRVFFSFHYQRDIWRVNVVRNSNIVEGCAAAGFQDASLWERAKSQGDAAVKRLIDNGLDGTSITVVLIGAETSRRQYVDYEIEQSIKRGNGLLGIYINTIEDWRGFCDSQGSIPWRLNFAKAPIYFWDRSQFGSWVEQAYHKAQGERAAASLPDYGKLIEVFGKSAPPPQSNQLGDLLRKYLQSPHEENK